MTHQHKPTSSVWTLATLALAVAIVVIDGTVLNVSIRDITSDLNITLRDIQWATTLYSLIIASLTIFGSRIGDIFGRKRAFIIGAVLFGLGSLITALSNSLTMLIAGWSIVEGVGAALMIPASSALLVSNFEGKERARAFALYGVSAGVASAAGPLLGGYLTTYFSWRLAFGINLGVVVLLCLGSLLLKGYALPKDKRPSLDYVGVGLSSLGLAALTYGFIQSSTYGWWTAKKTLNLMGRPTI
jgi:MFS family permease